MCCQKISLKLMVVVAVVVLELAMTKTLFTSNISS